MMKRYLPPASRNWSKLVARMGGAPALWGHITFSKSRLVEDVLKEQGLRVTLFSPGSRSAIVSPMAQRSRLPRWRIVAQAWPVAGLDDYAWRLGILREVRCMRRSVVLLCACLAVVFLATVWPIAQATAQSVTPTRFEATISPGEDTTLGLTVRTGVRPVPTIDVVFLIDITGSMSEEIAVVQSEARTIMSGIRGLVPDSRFGLATFSDYPSSYSYPGYSRVYGATGDTPWEVNQQPTTETTLVEDELNAILTRDGADHPEDYTRVLYEVMSMDWRSLTKKIVVLFGDAPAHDLDFAGYNNGGDPGRDAIAGTADDLDFETVVGQLSEEGVVVLAVYSGGTEPEGEATFRGVSEGYAGAEGTSGQFFLLEDAADIPQAIHDMVEEEVSTITSLELLITDEYRSWCTVSPASYTNVGPSQTKNFNVTITVPATQAVSIYSFLVRAVGDGALLGSCVVDVTVPGGDGDLDLGFRPDHDGFQWSNRSVASIPWAAFEQLFGRENVVHANGDRVFAAETWYETGWTGSEWTFGSAFGWREVGSIGLCHGFSACSIVNFADADQPNAGNFAMPHSDELYTDERTYGDFDQAIWFYHGTQMSYGDLKYYAVQRTNLGAGNHRAYLEKLEEYMRNDTPVILSYFYGAGSGHSVVPYRIEPDGVDPDISYVYVYDSNHQGQNDVRVEFDLNTGTVTTGDGNPWGYWITPLSLLLERAIGPWDPGAGDATFAVIALRGPGQVLLQDDSGRRLGFADGGFYDEIPGGMYAPPLGDEEGGGLFLVPRDVGVHATLEGTGTGNLTLTAFVGTWVGSIVTTTSSGETDEAVIGTGSLSVSLTPGETPKARSTFVAHELGDTSQVVAIRTASAGDTTVSLDEDGIITIVNGGPATTYDLYLEQRGEGKGSAEFEEISLVEGATHFIRVSDWDDLANSEITAEIDEDGDGDIDERVTLRGEGGLEASIAAPLDGSTVSGTVVVRGTAGGDRFESYRVEVGPGASPSSWSTVRTSTEPVSNGALAIWDASGAPVGSYTIRLTAESAGTAREASVAVYVEAGRGYGGPLLLAPNPVGSSGTAFYYSMSPGATSASLLVLTVSGRLVFETSLDLYGMRYPGGGYWDPIDENGVALANGPYVCVLVVDGKAIGQIKMLVQR